jgi:hypothetical protein
MTESKQQTGSHREDISAILAQTRLGVSLNNEEVAARVPLAKGQAVRQETVAVSDEDQSSRIPIAKTT